MAEERNLFKQFVSNMDSMLRENTKTDGRDQKSMLQDLILLEAKFKTLLLSHSSGRDTYKKFMKFIQEEKGNMLAARVYFRERQDTFSDKLFDSFHRNNSRMLHKFRINFTFAKWCLDHKEKEVEDKNGKVKRVKVYKNYKGPRKKQLSVIFNKIIETRSKLCENNLPLAINRAKIFWSKVPPSHLEYMDMIQAASEGLVTALDKFVPPYRTVFRSTAIGRMTLNMMTDYNDTLIKIPPKEKRILYRANNAKRKAHLTEQSKIVNYVNESFTGVTESSLSEIEAAASQIVDINHKADNSYSIAEKLADQTDNAEEILEKSQTKKSVYEGLSTLEVIERKIICLKNGEL